MDDAVGGGQRERLVFPKRLRAREHRQPRTGARAVVVVHRDERDIAIGMGERDVGTQLVGTVADGDHEARVGREALEHVRQDRAVAQRRQRLVQLAVGEAHPRATAGGDDADQRAAHQISTSGASACSCSVISAV